MHDFDNNGKGGERQMHLCNIQRGPSTSI